MSTKRWVSGAASVTDVWTLTLSGTVASQTYTLAIGSTSIVYVAGSGDTATTILAYFYAALTSVQSPPPAPFSELSYILNAGVSIVATQRVTGRPTVISFSSGGSATIASTNTTAATGPNFFDNAQNWSTGSAPANSDVLVFDSGSVSCKYNFNTSLTSVTLNVNPGYSGNIGLPDTNKDGQQYHEYRTTSLTLAGGVAVINSPAIQLCRLNFSSTLATVIVLNTGQRLDANTPVVLLTGGATSSELDVTKGDVGAAFFAGETANFPTIKMGYITNQATDAVVWAGVGLTTTTITKNGGVLTVNCAVTTLTQNTGGGSLVCLAGAITTLNANGGTVAYNSNATITTLNVANEAVVSFEGDPRSLTVTNAINLTGSRCLLIDNQRRINSAVLTVNRTDTPLANIQHGVTTASADVLS